jgi:hypothetical protein
MSDRAHSTQALWLQLLHYPKTNDINISTYSIICLNKILTIIQKHR